MSALEILFSTSPYPGLRPFHRHEADIFFGREEQTDELLRKLESTRFLAVVGPSGCGKSSLVRAGMIAGLETGYVAAAGSRWRVVTMRPESNPFRSLANNLLEGTDLFPGLQDSPSAVPLVEASLRRGPRGLVELLEGSPLRDGGNLLLLVDQFEEIFRFRREGDPDGSEAFVSLLLESARQSERQVFVVITMRADFLGDCAVFPGLPEMLSHSLFVTPRMTREQCRKAIVGPARVFDGDVDDALVTHLLNELDPEMDQLPVLQHALTRMWDLAGAGEEDQFDRREMPVITIQHYHEIGGQSALSTHADEAYGELDAEGQKLARRLFTLLTERGPNRRDVRRPAPLREVMSLTGASYERVAAVVDTFRRPDRSFLTPAADVPLDPDTVLDISHESLIRQWVKLSGWVEREGKSAATYRRLKDAAQAWCDQRGALWRDRSLEDARNWRDRDRPSSTWAARYGTTEDYALVERFLAESENAEAERLERKRMAAERRALEAEEHNRRERETLEREAQLQKAAAEAQRREAASAKRTVRFALLTLVLLLGAVIFAGISWRISKLANRELKRTQYELILQKNTADSLRGRAILAAQSERWGRERSDTLAARARRAEAAANWSKLAAEAAQSRLQTLNQDLQEKVNELNASEKRVRDTALAAFVEREAAAHYLSLTDRLNARQLDQAAAFQRSFQIQQSISARANTLLRESNERVAVLEGILCSDANAGKGDPVDLEAVRKLVGDALERQRLERLSCGLRNGAASQRRRAPAEAP